MTSLRISSVLLMLLIGAGCGDDAAPTDSGTRDAAGDTSLPDTGTDTGTVDSGVDTGTVDASDDASVDAGSDSSVADGGTDSAVADVGPDAMMTCEDAPTIPDRPTAPVCSACRPPSTTMTTGGACGTDADCTEGENGRCLFGRIGPFCNYDECFVDADCGSGQLCACDIGPGSQNLCIEAVCRTNSDCPGAHTCASSLSSCGTFFPPMGYYCHTDTDDCTIDSDCSGPATCRFNISGPSTGRWTCETSMCVG